MFNSLPYTDFHDLNIEWLLNTVKSLSATTANFQSQLNNLQAQIDNLNFDEAVQDYIENNPNVFDGYVKSNFYNTTNISSIISRVDLVNDTSTYTVEGAVLVGTNLYVSFYSASQNITSINVYNFAGQSPLQPTATHTYNFIGHANNLIYREDLNLIFTIAYGAGNQLISINPTTLDANIYHAFTGNLDPVIDTSKYLNVIWTGKEWYVFYTGKMPQCDIYSENFTFLKQIVFHTIGNQGCFYDNGTIMFPSSGKRSLIEVCDLDGNCLKQIFIPNTIDELEGIFKFNNHYYLIFNNELTTTDYFVLSSIGTGDETSNQFTLSSLGRNIRLFTGEANQLTAYTLNANPNLFSHLVFTAASASGTVIRKFWVENNFAETGSFYQSFVHTTAAGNNWLCGCQIAYNATSFTPQYMNMKTITDEIGSSINTTSPNWAGSGWKILTVDGVNLNGIRQSFPNT